MASNRSESQQFAALEAELAAARKMIADQEAEIALLRRQQHDAVDPRQAQVAFKATASGLKPVCRESEIEQQPGTNIEGGEVKVQSKTREAGERSQGQVYPTIETIKSVSNDRTVCPNEPLRGAGAACSVTNTRYKKTGGAADGAGNDYEHKMLSLVFLRMLAAGLEFQLASNMEAAGKFDDIVIRYRELSEDWNTIFVQLKHKQNKSRFITKPELLGLSGDLSLVGYCHSYEIMKLSEELHSFGNFNDHKITIFTNASIADSLVCEVEANPLLDTGGKAVSFKAGGEVFQGLCEWVDIKEALTELHGQVEGKSEEEVKCKIIFDLENMKFESKTVISFRGELLKTPTLVKLEALLSKLELVKDKDTYSLFLAKLQVYTNQVHESKLDAKIKEEFGKVWKCSVDLEADAMLHVLQAKVKSWWQKYNSYLTQDSPLWLEVIKSRTEALARSTIERLTEIDVEFGDSSLRILDDIINKMTSVGGILNLRVDSRTAASSLRVHQALAKFRPNEIVLHVHVKALLEREDEVLSAWTTCWCRLLVVECDTKLDQSQAERIGCKIMKVIGLKNKDKVVVLIAPEVHSLKKAVKGKTPEFNVDDSIKWGDLTQASQEMILRSKVDLQGTEIVLSDFEKKGKGFGSGHPGNKRRFRDCLVEQFDLEITSLLLKGVINCGKDLDKVDRDFVPRRLIKYLHGWYLVSVNSSVDVGEKIVLFVAEPGMGKTTLMTHFANEAKKEDPSAWIVVIRLNDCTAYLDSMDKETLDAEAGWTFLEHCALSHQNKVEELLFRFLEHKLVVFVDGVDEVNPHYEEQIFTLLRFLKYFKFTRLWVSSRPTFQSKLESVLKVDAFKIAELTVSEQAEFFNKTWKKKDFSLTDEECTKKTENLLKLFDNSLGKDASILGVPLMTKIIAEVFNSSIDKFVRNGRLDKTSLVKQYVEQRFEILCTEKMKMENRHLSASKDIEKDMRKRAHSNHCLAALRVIFTALEIKILKFKNKKHFYKDLNSYLEEVSNGREKIGIIDNVLYDGPHFTHRLFAEYFSALWLTSNFKTNRYFTKKIIFEPAYKALAEMFNSMLAEKHQLHLAVLHKEVETLESLLATQSNINEIDDGGRTALHLAVLLSGTDFTIVKILVEKYNARVDIADSIAGWSPLQYAEQARAWQALEFLLNTVVENIKDWPRPDPAVMLDAARGASVFVVRYLVEERGADLNCEGSDGETIIHIAAEGGNVEVLTYLVTKGLSLSVTDNRLNTTLHYATHDDHVSAVYFLLEQGLDMDARNIRGLTAFQEAALHGAYKVMAVLLELNASFKVNSSSRDYKVQFHSSLLCAAFAGSLECVIDLVRTRDSAFDFRDKKGHTAEWVAMHRGHDQVMDWLLLRESLVGDKPLHLASIKGELEIVTFILSRGDDIEAKREEDLTPLMLAVMDNKLDVIKLLLEKGANVESRDKGGNTPLHEASLREHNQAVSLLLRHGAKVNTTNNEGLTSLHTAIINNKMSVVTQLLDNDDNQPCTLVDRAGLTPLMTASLKESLDTVKTILETFNAEREGMSKADYINMKDSAGWNVLHFCSRLGQSGIISYIIGQGGDQTVVDIHDRTPLHLAAYNRRPGAVRALLAACKESERAAAVNLLDWRGCSVLMCAVLGGCLDCVTLSVEAGGKMTRVDEKGWTPLMIAASLNNATVVKFLLQAYDAQSEGMLLKDYINVVDEWGRTAMDFAIPECRKAIRYCLAQI